MEIKDKVIIITGASQGIGLAASKLLASKGAVIILAARSKEIITALEKEIPNSYAVVTDMRKEKDVKNLVKKTIEKYGRVDILINNAGQGMYGSVETIDIKNHRKIMDLNLYAVLNAMQEVIPFMRKQGKGAIINVSSGVAKRYIPGIAAYSSTKYALNAISFIARQELEKDNIIVSTISPKITSTNFAKNALGERPEWSGNASMQINTPEQVAEKIAQLIISEDSEIMM